MAMIRIRILPEILPAGTVTREQVGWWPVHSSGSCKIDELTGEKRVALYGARLQSKPLRGWGVSLRHVHLALAFLSGLHVLLPESS